MSVENLNHFFGYLMFVSFFGALPNSFSKQIHNGFVYAFWIAFTIWSTTGMFLLFG
jgi:hypothetical protein